MILENAREILEKALFEADLASERAILEVLGHTSDPYNIMTIIKNN